MKMSDYNDNVEQFIDEFEAKLLMIEDIGGHVQEKFKYLFRVLGWNPPAFCQCLHQDYRSRWVRK